MTAFTVVQNQATDAPGSPIIVIMGVCSGSEIQLIVLVLSPDLSLEPLQTVQTRIVNPAEHMNGRVYDPKLGRFLQADPFVDGVTSTQGYNRYSYVHNNPMVYTDPSGYWAQWVYVAFEILVEVLINTAYAYAFDQALDLATEFLRGGNSLAPGTTQGAYTNGITSDDFQAGCVSSTAVCGNVNTWPSTTSDFVDRTISHVMGRSTSVQTGGKFANGGASNFLTRSLGPGEVVSDIGYIEDQTRPPEIFRNEQFRDILGAAVYQTRSAVRTDKATGRGNRSYGIVIRHHEKNGYVFGERPNHLPTTTVPRGEEEGGGFAGSRRKIEGASAVVISESVYVRDHELIRNARDYKELSVDLSAPVIVSSPRSDVYVFDGANDPVKYNPR